MLPRADVLVALGTLEYVYDVPRTLVRLADLTKRLIVTYCCHRSTADKDARLRQGWLSDLTEEEFERHLNATGVIVKRTVIFQNEVNFKQMLWVADKP